MKLSFNRMFLAIMFALCPVLTLISTIKLKADYLSVVIAVIVTLAMLGILHIKNIYVKISVIVVAILLFILTNDYECIVSGVNELTSRFSRMAYKYTPEAYEKLKYVKGKYIADLVRVYVEIMIPSLYIVYQGKFWKAVYLMVSVPYMCLCFAIGLAPGIIPVYLMSFLYVDLIITPTKSEKKVELCNNTTRRINHIVIMGIVLLMLLVNVIANKVSPYERDEKYDEYKEVINAYLTGERTLELADLLDLILPNDDSVASGGISYGDLGSVDEIRFENTAQLEIEFSNSSVKNSVFPIYIKSYIGTEYTGDSWEKISGDKEELLLSFCEEQGITLDELYEIQYRILGSEAYIVEYEPVMDYEYSVRTLDNKDKKCYWPYFATVDMEMSQDGIYDNNGNYYKKQYFSVKGFELPSPNQIASIRETWHDYPVELMFLSGQDTQIWKDIQILYKYQKCVESVYLDIPESFENIAEEIRTSTYYYNNVEYMLDGSSRVYKEIGYQPYIETVRKYLSDCTYTLSPGRLESGEDFVLKFLTETKKGYCSHFASAGVLLFRSLGVPARYVEGYAVNNDNVAGGTVTVLDSSAHAWVEIFAEGIGWVPVEVTPSSYREVVSGQTDEIKETSSTNPNETTSRETTSTETTSGETTTNENTTKKPEETTKPGENNSTSGEEVSGDGSGSGSGGSSDNRNSRVYTIIFVIFGVTLVSTVIACFCRRKNKKNRRYKKILESSNYRKQSKIFIDEIKEVMKYSDMKLNTLEKRQALTLSISNLLNRPESEKILSEEEIGLAVNAIYKFNYGQDEMTENDASAIIKLANILVKSQYESHNLFTKFHMRYIKCLYLFWK